MADDLLNVLGSAFGSFMTGWRETRRASLVSHWFKPFADFKTSSTEFYDEVEKTVGQHQIPALKVDRVLWRERGLLSTRRIYLRFTWKRYVWDLCAAPFGTGFFFSSWLVILPRALTLLHLAGAVTTVVLTRYLADSSFGVVRTTAVVGAALIFLLWLLQSGRLETEEHLEEFLLGITIWGAIYDRFFRSITYYELDTAETFQSLVHGSALEVVDALTKAKNLEPLSEAERKPIMRDFFKRR